MYNIRNHFNSSDTESTEDTESTQNTESSQYTESSQDTELELIETDTETDSEYEYELYAPEMENIFDMIYYDDIEFLDTDKENNHYYLGLHEYIRSLSEFVIGTTISTKIFYKYTYGNVSRYLRAYSIIRNKFSTKNINIMQLKIHPTTQTYNVIIKTYWIRLIQLHWKKIYKERMNFIQLRKRLQNQRYFELNGRYMIGSNTFPPSLYGMLSIYNK